MIFVYIYYSILFFRTRHVAIKKMSLIIKAVIDRKVINIILFRLFLLLSLKLLRFDVWNILNYCLKYNATILHNIKGKCKND